MNSNFDTSKYRFENLTREEQNLLVLDSVLNRVKLEFWSERSKAWCPASDPCWNNSTRYRRKPEVSELTELLDALAPYVWGCFSGDGIEWPQLKLLLTRIHTELTRLRDIEEAKNEQ